MSLVVVGAGGLSCLGGVEVVVEAGLTITVGLSGLAWMIVGGV